MTYRYFPALGLLTRAVLFAALVFTASVFAAPAKAQTPAPHSKAEIEKIINDYLMENPEALATALNNMQEYYRLAESDRLRQTIAKNRENLVANPADFSIGPPDAPITIVEFFDYNCGYCKRVFPTLMEVVNENSDVRVVFKELPILSAASTWAAKTALAFDDQLAFLTFHTKLMTHKSRLNEAYIATTLADMKVDRAALGQRREAPRIQAILDENARLARLLNLEGTPAFIIGDQVLPGALDKSEFDTALAAMRDALAEKN